MPSLTPKSKRPRFALTIIIHELANIPQVSGSVSVRWYIKDTTSKQPTRGRTSVSKIHDHRAVWDYTISTKIRLSINRQTKHLNDKFLVLIVYMEFPNKEKSTLGKVEINLAEYASMEDPTANRYLLQESKVNCIINVLIGMELLRGESDFIVPPMRTTQIFRGITGVIDGQQQPQFQQNTINSNSLHPTTVLKRDPVISKLYYKSFQFPWDPRPNELPPDKCIEDIFAGGDGWIANKHQQNGDSMIYPPDVSRAADTLSSDSNSDSLDPGTKKRGLLKEESVRSDLKSWTINQY